MTKGSRLHLAGVTNVNAYKDLRENYGVVRTLASGEQLQAIVAMWEYGGRDVALR